jgi:signal transduction histidine kinase
LCDAVSADRGFIADPLLYQHLRDGTPGPRCVDCNACVGHIGSQPLDCYRPRVRQRSRSLIDPNRVGFVAKIPFLSVLPLAVASEAAQHLVDYLVRQQAFIGEQVVRTIRATGSIPGAFALTDKELIDHFPQLFADLAEYFLREASLETRKRTVEAAVKHGKTRWRQGYHLTELVRELWLVQKSILDLAIERFFELNPQWVTYSKTAWKNLTGFFEDSVAGYVQRYVDDHTEELRHVNSRLLEANRNLSRIDGLRLRLIRTVSHEIANVLNTLNLTMSFLTASDDRSSREEMLRTCQRNVQEMSDLLDDLKNYSLLLDEN